MALWARDEGGITDIDGQQCDFETVSEAVRVDVRPYNGKRR